MLFRTKLSSEKFRNKFFKPDKTSWTIACSIELYDHWRFIPEIFCQNEWNFWQELKEEKAED